MKADSDLEAALRASFTYAAGPLPTELPHLEPALRLRCVRRRRRARRRSLITVVAVSAALPAGIAVHRLNDHPDRVAVRAAGGTETAGSDGIFRPLLGIDGCITTNATERTLVGAGEPMNDAASTQVIYQPDRPPPSGPLIIIFRSEPTRATANPTRSGTLAIDPVTPGRQGGATWALTDGSEATAYARNLATEEFAGLVDSLEPNPVATEGFLLQPSPSLPKGYVSTEVSSTAPSATVTTSRCQTATDATHVVTVTAITGREPAAYAALLNTSASAATGRRGETMVFVDGSSQTEAQHALTQIRDATRAEWARYRTSGGVSQPTTPPTTR